MPTAKVKLNDDIRRFNLSSNVSFHELYNLIRNTFEIPERFRVKYLDEDNDHVSISTNMELEEAFRSAGTNILRLFVFIDPESKTNPPTSLTSQTTETSQAAQNLQPIFALFAQQLGLTQSILTNMAQGSNLNLNASGNLSSSFPDLGGSFLQQSNPDFTKTVLDTLQNCSLLQNMLQQQNLVSSTPNINELENSQTHDSYEDTKEEEQFPQVNFDKLSLLPSFDAAESLSKQPETEKHLVKENPETEKSLPKENFEAEKSLPKENPDTVFIPLVRGYPTTSVNNASPAVSAELTKSFASNKSDELEPYGFTIINPTGGKIVEAKPFPNDDLPLSESRYHQETKDKQHASFQLDGDTDSQDKKSPKPQKKQVPSEFAEELQILAEMGFLDVEKNVRLLQNNGRDMGLTIAQLCE